MRALWRLVLRHLLARRARTLLAILGVAASVALFVGVESLARGLDDVLASGDAARTLVVYRQNRYCPQASYLPERYARSIGELGGVESVLPVRVYLSNCRASLDIVAFQGAPVEELLAARDLELLSGDLGRFRGDPRSALVGREFAARRNLEAGDSFRFGGIAVDVAGVFASTDPAEESLILTHLDYLQRAGPVNRLGTVTQFEVRVAAQEDLARVAAEIDALFGTAEEPTDTRGKTEFLAGATRELREILRFGRAFGWVCVGVILILVANTLWMSYQERASEQGTLLTLGYSGRHLAFMVLLESLALTLSGGALGLSAAWVLERSLHLAIGVEGVTVGFALSWPVAAEALAIAVVCAALAALVPVFVAARSRPVALLGSH